MKTPVSIVRLVVLAIIAIAIVDFVKQGVVEKFLKETANPLIVRKIAHTSDEFRSLLSKSSISTENASRAFSEDSGRLLAEDIIDATNKERIALGLLPLTVDVTLMQSAQHKNNDMIVRQYFEHVSPDGKSVSDLGTEFGYQYIIMGENLALGAFTDSADLVTAWMKSPGHRANIVSTKYQDIGVAVAQGLYKGKTVWFATQHFGTERRVCPTIDTQLKESVQSLSLELKKREVAIEDMRKVLESPDRPKGDAYNQLVSVFNQLITEYNNMLGVLKEETAQYNAQVNAFNSCLSRYQTK